MDYAPVVYKINRRLNRTCFRKTDYKEFEYLSNLNIHQDILQFYQEYNPINIIEINNIRLLPIADINEENNDYTPGYILSRLACCVIATTNQGDVYCIKNEKSNYVIILASHDEIDSDQTEEEVFGLTRLACKTFYDFLEMFIEERLVASYYDFKD